MKRCSEPRPRASRASAITSRVPSTLIARASSSGRSNEIDAAQCSTVPARSATVARPPLESPRPGRVRSAGTARTRSRYSAPGLAPQPPQDAVDVWR